MADQTVNALLGCQVVRAAQTDRPRFLRDIVAVPLEDGILIDGLGRQEVIRGPIAQTILPALLNLMDGTRTPSQLEDAFSTSTTGYVQTALSLLNEWGMLEKPADCVDPEGANPDTMAFLRRCIASLGLETSAREAYDRLRSAKVFISASGDAAQAERLRSLLTDSGIGVVDVIPDKWNYTNTFPQKALIVALGNDGEDTRWYEDLERRREGEQFSWLRAVINEAGSIADIGPLFTPEKGTCYQCFRVVHVVCEHNLHGKPQSPGDEMLWASFLAIEVILLFALPGLATTCRRFQRFSLPEWDSQSLIYPRLPGCQLCRKQALFSTECRSNPETRYLTDTALVFEEYVALESRSALFSGHKNDFAQVSVSKRSKQFPTCQQILLYRGGLQLEIGTLEAMRSDREVHSDALTLDSLAAILATTAGIREINQETVNRWAATAGNFGSVELFVAARSVHGLPQGIYLYQPEEHSLAHFRKRNSLEISEFMCRVLGLNEDSLPDALILFTGAFHRLVGKYGPFGYRLISLDAGSALSQLHLVARGLNLYARTATNWADDLIQEQLNLNGFDEQPTAVIEISGNARKRKGLVPILSRPRPEPKWPVSHKAGGEFRSLKVEEVTEMLFNESQTREANLWAPERMVSNDLLANKVHSTSIIKLPKVARAGLSVSDVLALRRSVRDYDGSPVRLDVIATALHLAHSMDAAEWPDEHRHTLRLSYLLLARNVKGIQEGIYEYDPRNHQLGQVGPSLSREQTVELLVQSEYADAPVLVWIAGNLAAACARHGAWGHRQLLLRAGAAGHRLWMSSLGLGLSGSIFAGLVPGAARKYLGLDGYKRASLFAFVAGHRKGPQ